MKSSDPCSGQSIGISTFSAFRSLQLLLFDWALRPARIHITDSVVRASVFLLYSLCKSINYRSDWVSITRSLVCDASDYRVPSYHVKLAYVYHPHINIEQTLTRRLKVRSSLACEHVRHWRFHLSLTLTSSIFRFFVRRVYVCKWSHYRKRCCADSAISEQQTVAVHRHRTFI